MVATAVTLVSAGCESTGVERSAQAAASAPLTLEECAAIFAAEVHAYCTDSAPAPTGPGTAPGTDGLVGREGDDPFGRGVAPDLATPALGAPSVDVHCAGPALAAAKTARSDAFRACVRDRADPGVACASAAEAPCPPGLNEVECAAALDAAAGICAEETGP